MPKRDYPVFPGDNDDKISEETQINELKKILTSAGLEDTWEEELRTFLAADPDTQKRILEEKKDSLTDSIHQNYDYE